MNEVIKSITEAEEKAAEIKANATERAAEIYAEAEKQADEISKKSETECKLYRETALKKAEKEAEANYAKYIAEKKEAAKKYADSVINGTGGTVNAIVRRIESGSC